MYPTTASVIIEKNRREGSYPIYLYAIDTGIPGTVLYFTSNNASVSFFIPGTNTPQTYMAAPVEHDKVDSNTKGEISGVQLTLTNIDRYIMNLLETYDALRGRVVTILLVFSGSLGDYTNCLRDDYYIDSCTVNESTAMFNLTSKFVVDKISIPKRIYRRDQCSWSFKGAECGKVTTATLCNKLLSTCKNTYSNQARYGGFPTIPSKGIYF